jgi:hypothetical protein
MRTEVLDIVQAVVELKLAYDDIDCCIDRVSKDMIPDLAGFVVSAVPGDMYTVMAHDGNAHAGVVICVN